VSVRYVAALQLVICKDMLLSECKGKKEGRRSCLFGASYSCLHRGSHSSDLSFVFGICKSSLPRAPDLSWNLNLKIFGFGATTYYRAHPFATTNEALEKMKSPCSLWERPKTSERVGFWRNNNVGTQDLYVQEVYG
jgi:hypothetical protein